MKSFLEKYCRLDDDDENKLICNAAGMEKTEFHKNATFHSIFNNVVIENLDVKDPVCLSFLLFKGYVTILEWSFVR